MKIVLPPTSNILLPSFENNKKFCTETEQLNFIVPVRKEGVSAPNPGAQRQFAPTQCIMGKIRLVVDVWITGMTFFISVQKFLFHLAFHSSQSVWRSASESNARSNKMERKFSIGPAQPERWTSFSETVRSNRSIHRSNRMISGNFG